MQPQLDMDVFHEPEGYGIPRASEPFFWIKELRILSKWTDSEAVTIRTIQFRKGLNVIWSPPMDMPGDVDQRLAGHASGKTTLCRLIRYVLGEQKVGTETFRNAVTHKFPEGVVVAEIRLKGETWCVARPFTAFTSSKCCAQKGVVLDAFLRTKQEPGTYEAFRVAMEVAAKEIVSFDHLPDGSHLGLWHYFPWFTRDQEAQFLKLYAWRENTSSEADSPMLKQDQKAYIMRSIYDPAVADELELIVEYERLNAEIEQAQKDEVKLSGACDADREWMLQFPATSGLDVSNELDVEAWIARMIKERTLAENVPIEDATQKALLENSVQSAHHELSEAMIELNECQSYLRTQHAILNDLEKSANMAETPAPPPDDRVEAAAAFKPNRRFCRVPIVIARQRGCKVAEEYIGDHKKREEAAQTLRQVAANSVDGQREKVDEIKDRIAKVSDEIKELKRRYDNAVAERDACARRIELAVREKVQTYTEAISSVDRYQADEKKLITVRAEIENKKNVRKDVSAQLARLRASREKSGDVTDYFQHVIRFILGKKVVGRVIADKDSIKLECLFNDAKYNSAALDAAYNVMFDLTVLVMAIQGKSSHPRFLMHDGPRVADVSTPIYYRYFEFAEDLENRANGNPNFQYIITTTEPPPERFRDKKKYLCLELNAATPEGRLLKCDLRG